MVVHEHGDDGDEETAGHNHGHMHEGTAHKALMDELEHELQPILENSTCGVYLMMDEESKFCNELLAKMFGYTASEWKASSGDLEDFVHPDDIELFALNYDRYIATLDRPVTFKFRGKRKDGSYFNAETDMIPLMYKDHVVAYHFVRELK